MVSPKSFFEACEKNNIDFFTGVPDSLLADFCAYVANKAEVGAHVIAANEGNAVGLAAGHYLATEHPGLVYLQNSGLGNTVNPLVSLADPIVYSIPMLLVIGWRGRDSVPDEPQHAKQGKITEVLLDTLGIPYVILPDSDIEAGNEIKKARIYMQEKNAPFAILVKEKTFSPYVYEQKNRQEENLLSREEALSCVLDVIPNDAVIVSTTGKLSRELFELREVRKENHSHEFLTVGGMGHASQIALGIALAKPDKKIFCFDGDGAAIMHLGGWGVIGQMKPKNFTHVVFNNGAHDSVGGQPTAARVMDFPVIAKACGYTNAVQVTTMEEIKNSLTQLQQQDGPVLLEINIKSGARANLGRPTRTPIENKNDFMQFLNGNE